MTIANPPDKSCEIIPYAFTKCLVFAELDILLPFRIAATIRARGDLLRGSREWYEEWTIIFLDFFLHILVHLLQRLNSRVFEWIED
jgi:hypothetical protein